MLNNVILIGKIVHDPELSQTPNGKKVTTITLAVARSFKNSSGVFETDFVCCRLWAAIATSTVEFCQQGSLIAIKGRLQTRSYENGDNKFVNVTEVIAERVNFLNEHNPI
ncbi:MAG: single-stranded DNA-binding protein [Culicoidibacterales bacterium]